MWLSDYACRKKGAVNATTAGAQALYQLELVVGESSGASGCDIHCENHCLNFPNDIRFTTEDEETKHDHWVDISSLEGTTPNRKVSVWIEVASIPASGTVDFYIYYGKIDDPGSSSGISTFNLFQEFDGLIYDYGYNPVLDLGTPGSFDSNGLYDTSILKVGSTFYLYYSAYPGTQLITEGLATSPDGITWTKQGKVLDLGATGDWDDLKAHDVAVIEDDGTWYMWYSGTRNPEATYGLKIGLATSTNGFDWTKKSGCANCPGCAGDGCVFDKGAAGKFDDQHVVYPAIIKEGSTYYMWYSGVKSGSGYSGIGLATSTDGINWTRQNNGDAVFEKGTDTWENNYIYQADVKKIGDYYWMVYTGANSSGVRRLGLAYSPDKLNWTRYLCNPILELGGSGEWDETSHGTGAFYTTIYPEVRLYYTGYDTSGDQRIGFVTIPDIDALLDSDWTEEVNGASASITIADSKVRLQATDAGHYANLYSKPIKNAPCALQVQGWNVGGIGNLAIKLTKDGAWPIQTDAAKFTLYDQTIGGGGNSDLNGWMCWGGGSEETWRDYNVGDTYNKDDVDILIGNDRKVEWKIEGASKGVSTAALDNEQWRVQLTAIGERGAADMYIDRLFLRNYASPEPTWDSWSAEECSASTKVSSIGLTITSLEEKTKASSIGLTISEDGVKTKASSIGLTITSLEEKTKESSIGLTVYVDPCPILEKGLFYAKLGNTILEAIVPENFRISEEINKIPSFEFEVANSEVNRTAIAANPTALFKIYWQHYGADTLIFTGIINADGIEYVSLTSIKITGFSSYAKLGWPLYKRLGSGDMEPVNIVLDYNGTHSDYTGEANNDNINDVNATLGAPNHCFYIGDTNPFFGFQITYSTKGIPGNADIVIEFSKGNDIWGTLNVLDKTHAFTEDPGTYDVIIAHPPSDWKRNTVIGGSKFWIRWRVKSGSYTTSPKLDRIRTLNVDIYRVFHLATSARAILLDVLKDTEYTMDTVDACPQDEINLLSEYESKLRVIAAIPAALTWTDTDGSKKAYQWWIDDAKKVHIKKRRGTTFSDDITGDLTIFNNLVDYFNLSNSLIGFGKRDGLSQIRAIVEDIPSQVTHGLRELAVSMPHIDKYITLKESLEKNIAISKDPMQRIKGSVTTEFWGNRGYEVGDTITLHQGEWVVEEGEFQIVKVDRGPLLTQLNLGISQEHLEGLKSNMARALDINNVQMHGSTSVLTAGPETSNYERKLDGSVFASKLKIDIPSEVAKIHKVLLSWTIGPYRASVNEHTGSVPGHDHGGFGGAGGAIAGGFAGSGGAFTPEVLDGGDFTPAMLSEAHQHDLSDTLTIDFGEIVINSVANEGVITGLEHAHNIPSLWTGNPDETALAVHDIEWGEWCEACSYWLISHTDELSFGTDTHWHKTPTAATGNTSPPGFIEHHPISVVFTINPYVLQTTSLVESPAHLHDGIYELPHDHSGVAEGPHNDHTIPAEPAHADHLIIVEPGSGIDIDFGIHEEAAGTVLELLVNGEKIGEYSGAQTEIRIDGYLSTGTNTIEIQPIAIETGKKGGATILGTGILFVEPKKF